MQTPMPWIATSAPCPLQLESIVILASGRPKVSDEITTQRSHRFMPGNGGAAAQLFSCSAVLLWKPHKAQAELAGLVRLGVNLKSFCALGCNMASACPGPTMLQTSRSAMRRQARSDEISASAGLQAVVPAIQIPLLVYFSGLSGCRCLQSGTRDFAKMSCPVRVPSSRYFVVFPHGVTRWNSRWNSSLKNKTARLEAHLSSGKSGEPRRAEG